MHQFPCLIDQRTWQTWIMHWVDKVSWIRNVVLFFIKIHFLLIRDMHLNTNRIEHQAFLNLQIWLSKVHMYWFFKWIVRPLTCVDYWDLKYLMKILRCTPISICCLLVVLISIPNHILLKHRCMIKRNIRIRHAYLRMAILRRQTPGFFVW